MAIDYNTDILPFYASRLEGDDAYIQEEASAAGGTYPADEIRGASGDQLKVNTVDTVAMVPANPVLQDWLDAIQALGQHGIDFEASIVDDSIVIVGIGGTSLVIADGTAGGGLAATGLNAGTTVGGGDLNIGRADQTNEQRILTTLGVLVSHLRLIGSRDESRNLHFVLSRIATGVGSGGFVYQDRTASVSGNVKNPTYSVGDEVNIRLINEGENTPSYTPVDITGVSASPFDLDQMVTDINNGGQTADQLTASNDGGYLKLHSENGLSINIVDFSVLSTNNNAGTNKSGLEYGATRSKRNEVAEKVKEEALDYFDTNRRDLTL